MRFTRGVLAIGATAGCLWLGSARAQVEITVDAPPDEYIATTQPVYFEGHAAYWYDGRWRYKDRAGWRTYGQEPAFLRNYRAKHAPVRQEYGRDHGGGYRSGRR